MGQQITHAVEAPELRPTLISGRFFPNGNSQSPLSFVGRGVASVQRTANAGEFLVTLQENHAQVIAFDAAVQHVTAADLQPQFGAFSNVGGTSATTFILRVLAAAVGTDIVANADSSVSFWVLFNDSGVQ